MRALALLTAFAGVALLGTGCAGIARFLGASPRSRRGVAALVTVIAVLAGAATAGYALFAVSTSASITTSTADSFTPVPPPSCSWTNASEVTLTWDADPDATSYDVMRSTAPNSGYASMQNVNNSTFTYVDTTVNPDARPVGVYYYKLRVNTVGVPRTSAAASSTTCAGYVATWAGGVADGRDATDVAMSPQGIAVSGTDLYVAGDNVVRRIDINTGDTTVIAGVGADASAGVPGPGELANIKGSAGVATDGDGNRYITDSSQHVVYRVDDNGDVSVFAGQIGSACNDPVDGCGNGGPATSAQLNGPIGVATDDDGNVYISDSGDQAIRKVDAGGDISRVVGTGEQCADPESSCGDGGSATAAQLNSPFMLAWGNGGLFIADNGDHRVRFWNGSTIETVAGSGSSNVAYGGDFGAGLRFDTPVAYSRDGDDEIVAQADGRIRLGHGGMWQTVAGLGSTAGNAPDGDSGFAIEARIPSIPIGGAVIWHGRYFVSDPAHHRVRVVTHDGRIGTLAGSGAACVPNNGCGDGGRALDADLTPGGLAVAPNGTLFIADSDANQVRAVSPTGIITTVAGTGAACAHPTDACGDDGNPTAAQLNAPAGLSYLADNDTLFIADRGDRRVRVVTLVNDVPDTIMTIAGTGASGDTGDGGSHLSATFVDPVAVVVSGARLVVADAGSHRLRAFTLGGNIGAYAGDGTAGNSGDGGTATSARLDAPVALGTTNDGKTVVVDRDRNRLRAIDDGDGTIDNLAGDANGAVATWAGDGGQAVAATLNPFAVAWDGTHDLLYVTDAYAGRVRRVDIGGDGRISTVAGAGSSPVPRTDGNGNVIARYFGDGGPAVDAGLTLPAGLAVDGAGNVYVGDFAGGRVRKIEHGTGTLTTVAGTGNTSSRDASARTDSQFGPIAGAARDGDGNVYVADGRRVRKIGATDTSTFAGNGAEPTWGGDDGAAVSAQLDAPGAMAQDAFGNTYVADGARIRRIGPDGTIHAFAGTGAVGYHGDGDPATQAELSRVGGIAVDADDNVYFTDTDNHVVRRVDTSGKISTVAGTGGSGYTGDGLPPRSADVGSPVGIAMASAHAFYIADTENAVVRKVDLDADTITVAAGTGTPGFSGDNGPATSAQLDQPTALATNNDGSLLFIFDAANHRIRSVFGGTIVTVAGDGTIGGSGDGGSSTTAKLGASLALAYTENDDILYIADTDNNRIRELHGGATMERGAGSASGTAGFAGDGGDPADAAVRFDAPRGIVATAWGSAQRGVIVADTGNRRVRSLAFDGPRLMTIAGTGRAATWAGDGGDATVAALGLVLAITTTADGTVYFAEQDTNDMRIRRIATNGTISTVAGSAACLDSASACGAAAIRSMLGCRS